MSTKPYTPTQDAQDTVQKFTQLDNQFKTAYEEFYARHQTELDQLDAIRENRNVALDEAQRLLRDEANRLDIKKYKRFEYGPFTVQRKETEWFRSEEFVRLAKDEGVEKRMKDEGVIATKIEINTEVAHEFLKKNSLADRFATTLDSKELTPSISGPKPIPGFGQEVKTK